MNRVGPSTARFCVLSSDTGAPASRRFTADVCCNRVVRDALIESGVGVAPASCNVFLTEVGEPWSMAG